MIRAMRQLRCRRSGSLWPEPVPVSALRVPAAIAGEVLTTAIILALCFVLPAIFAGA